MIILMAGLPGTGTSTVARALAKETAGCVLSKDEIRAALFAPDDIEYSTAQDDFCMEIMLQAASFLLQKDSNRKVFLDGLRLMYLVSGKAKAKRQRADNRH